MATFKDVVRSSDRAFGMNLKQAWKIQRIKSFKESLMKARNKVAGFDSGRYYLVSKDYAKVQWRALFSGNVITSSFYWTGMATARYCFATYALFGKHDLEKFSSDLATASIFIGFAAIAQCFQSRKLVKKLKKEQEQIE